MQAAPSPLSVVVEGAVARVRLERPEKRNAFDERLAAALEQAFAALAARPEVRVAVLSGAGAAFCAGGDLEWMRRAAQRSRAENLDDAAAFQRTYEAIDTAPFAVVARVHGAALGGGAGMVAACDVALAAEGTTFGFTEVRLGLVPGVISPYVLRRIGPGPARRWFVTGERFDAEEAQRMGLVHGVAPEAQLDVEVTRVVDALLACSPQAVAHAKAVLRAQAAAGGDRELQQRLAREAIADARASADGREGTTAFLEKRKPRWAP
ncbi:MAG: enoyl-CoA hydratase-related protein [Planctomycetia bacterium]